MERRARTEIVMRHLPRDLSGVIESYLKPDGAIEAALYFMVVADQLRRPTELAYTMPWSRATCDPRCFSAAGLLRMLELLRDIEARGRAFDWSDVAPWINGMHHIDE